MRTAIYATRTSTQLVLLGLGLITPLLLAGRAFAQSEVDASRQTAIVKAIESVGPAAVTVNIVEIQTERLYDPMFEEFYRYFGAAGPQPRVRKQAVQSMGTGFFFDDQGHIMTNFHVIEGADYGTVTLPDGRELEFDFVGGDERTDVAVLKVKGENLPHVRLGDSDSMLVGEWVIAIGNPFGMMMRDPQPSVSVGVVSAVHRRVSRDVAGGERLYQDLIQTDAAINPGNSGGPLANAAGEVIGMNTMIFSNTGGYQGLGFAIPINRARRVAEEIIQFGRRRDPWMGFRGEAVRELAAYSLRQLGITAESGVLVTEILPETPAYEAGLRPGDVILKMNGESIEYPADVDYITWGHFVGDRISVEIDRQGKRQDVEYEIRELKARDR